MYVTLYVEPCLSVNSCFYVFCTHVQLYISLFVYKHVSTQVGFYIAMFVNKLVCIFICMYNILCKNTRSGVYSFYVISFFVYIVYVYVGFNE